MVNFKMPREARLLKEKACYYIVARCAKGKHIFYGLTDYAQYSALLRKYKNKFNVSLIGFCLLPASVHLILQPKEPKGLSSFMQGVNQSFAIYFNRKYRSSGQLWFGRFRSVVLDNVSDLVECIKYVEFKPVKENLVFSPVEYPWSSCSLRVLGYKNGILDVHANLVRKKCNHEEF